MRDAGGARAGEGKGGRGPLHPENVIRAPCPHVFLMCSTAPFGVGDVSTVIRVPQIGKIISEL